MNMTKRILALLLSLSLVIGMMPGISLTAFAEETAAEEATSAETVPETTAEETEPAETLPEETVSETTVSEETVPEETESEETAEEPASVEVVVFNPVTKEVMGTQLASDVNYIDPDMEYSWENPYYPVWDWNTDGTEISAFMQTEADYISFAVTVSGAMYFGDQFITNVNGTEEEPYVMTCWGPEDGSLWGLMVTVKIGQFEEEPEEEPPVAAWEYIEDEEWDTVDWETSWEEPFNPTWTYNEDGTGMSACITVTEGIDYIIYYIPQSGALYEGGWPDGDGYTDAWFYYNAEAGQTGRIKWQSDGDFSLRLTIMFADGESGGNQPSEPDGSVANEQYLQDQIDAGYGEIFVDQEIVLENDFVIPEDVGFTVYNKITVPDGVTLTVDSGRFFIQYGGLLHVEEGGHLVIGNTISCWNGASMVIDGTYEFTNEWGYIIVNYENGVSADQFSGIADEDISLRFIPATEAELQDAAEVMNSAGFGSYIVLVHDSLTLTEDFIIPGNCTFTISDAQSTVTVSEGVTLTNYGNLYVNPDETLHNYGTIVNNGQFSNDGTVINDGEVQNNRYLNNWGIWQGNDPAAPPMSQDDLEGALDALDPYNNYWLNQTVTLERDLTIDEDQYLGIGPSGKLIVPEGITLTAGTNINVNAGGTLEIQGEFVKAHQEPWLLSVGYENGKLGNVIGIDRKDIALDYYVNINNPDALQGAEALLEEWGFGWNYIYQWVDVTLEDDFIIPENTFLHLYADSTLTVPEGVTLTNKGELYVWENTQLVNNGTIENDRFMLVVGTMENNGTVNVNDYLVVDGPGTVQNNGDVTINGGYELYGTWLGNALIAASLNEQYIQDKIDAGETSITLDQKIVLQNDYTIPEGIELYIQNELVVPDGVTLTIDASYCHVFENGILLVEEGGYLISNVNIFGESGATVDIAGTYALAEHVTIQADYENGAFVSTVEGVAEEDMSLQFNLHSAEELENAAIIMDESNYGQYFLDIWNDMTLTGDLTLPANCTALIEIGVEVTIPEDCTVTNNGNLYIMRDSTLHNYGTILNGLIFAIEGGTFVNDGVFVDMGWIMNNGTWEGNEPQGMTQEELEDALSECSGYYELTSRVILEEDMTIDENKLWIAGGSLIVPEGITLTVDSEIAVYPGGTLDVQGSVDGEGTISLLHDDRGGSSTVNGVPMEMQYLYYDVFNPDNLPGVMEKLSESNFPNVMITLQNGDVTLAEDMIIPKHITLRAVNGDVTVEEGVTIDVEGQLMATIGPAIINHGRICVTGTLSVSSESTLINNGLIDISGGCLEILGESMVFGGARLENNGTIQCRQYGTIEIEGEFVSGEASSVGTWYHNGELFGTINGIPTSDQNLLFDIYSEDQLIEAMEIIVEDNYKSYHAEIYADITLTEDLTIPEECEFYMGYNNLTIAEGVELTNNGRFTIYAMVETTLTNDGIITNNGAFTLQEDATVQNNGSFVNNGTIENSGTWNGNPAVGLNETYLQAQIDAGKTEIVADIDLTFGESFTVPEGVTLIVEEGVTLTIPEGSLNVRGKLINDGIINVGGPAKQNEIGWYTILDGVFVRKTGFVENNGEIFCGESAYVGSYGIWEGNDAVVTPISQDVFEHNLELNGNSYYYELDKPVILEQNMTLSAKLIINGTGSLTVPEGIKLTVADNEGQTLRVYSGGILDVQGEIELQEDQVIMAWYGNSGNPIINGVSNDKILNQFMIDTDLQGAIDLLLDHSDYAGNMVNAFLNGEETLNQDLIINAGDELYVYGPGALVIPEDVTVTVKGTLYIMSDVVVLNNGTVVKSGTVINEGAWEGNAPVANSIADTGRTLSLDGMIYINQYVKPEGFEGVDIEKNGGLLIWNAPISEEDAVFGSEDTHVAGLMDAGKGEYAQQGPGIVAKSYADDIYLRVYIKDNDGNYVYSPLTVYSVRTYCESRLEKSSNAKLKSTCANLLHFGAAAQTYFGYNTDDLANANIVDTWPQPEWDASLIDALEEPVTNIVGTGTVSDNGKTLSLTGALFVNFYFGLDASVGEPTTAELLFWDEVDGELTLDNVTYKRDLIATGTEYAAQSDMFAAREFGKTLFVCAHFVDEDGNDHYSDVTAYSPEEYAAGRLKKSSNENLKALVKAMVTYGEAARLYFAK